MLSRFMSAALIGTTTDRNTIISNRNESVMTAAIKSGNRSLTRFPMSPKVAVCPPMCAVAALSSSTPGKTSPRRRSMVVSVALS